MSLPLSFTTQIRRIMYTSLYRFDQIVGRKAPLVSILCYHSVSNDQWRYSVDVETITKQLKWLKQHFTFISLSDLEQFFAGNKKLTGQNIVITFDDGYADLLSIKQLCVDLKLHPTVFLIADTARANRGELETERPFLSSKETHQLIQAGWEVGCHSMSHADFSQLSAAQIDVEIIQSKKALEQELKTTIRSIAYPKGQYTQAVISAVRAAGYTLGLTMDDAIISPKTNQLKVPRIGVDRTHDFVEFQGLTSPSCLRLRQFIKSTPLGKLM